MKFPLRMAVIVLAILCCATMAAAREATWSFATAFNPASPDAYYNQWGAPAAVINVDAEIGTGWYDTLPEVYGTEQGWWDVGYGSIVLTIPGMAEPNPEPETVWVEVTYWSDFNQAPAVSFASQGATFAGKVTTLVEAGPVFGGWYKDRWTWTLAPSLAPQTITVAGDPVWGSQITRIAVVPEPSALLALCTGIAGLAGVAARRRRG